MGPNPDSGGTVYSGTMAVIFFVVVLYLSIAFLLASLRVNGMIGTLVLWVLAVIPCVGLAVMLVVYLQASSALKRNGVRRGFLGVDRDSYPALTPENAHLPAGMSDGAAITLFITIAMASVTGLALLLFTFGPTWLDRVPIRDRNPSEPEATSAAEQGDAAANAVSESVRGPLSFDPTPAVLVEMREWTNREGKTMRAELISVTPGTDGELEGEFVRDDGKEFTYRIPDLSDADISLIKTRLRTAR